MPLDDIRARTEARRVAGFDQTYPKHEGTAVAVPISSVSGQCAHLGERTGETRACPTCAGVVQLKLFECVKHGVCTPDKPVEGVACCAKCPDNTRRQIAAPFPHKFSWVPTAQLIRDSIVLAGILPHDCSGIVGVPRSGMIPASVIAAHLHLPLYSFHNGGVVKVSVGASRGNVARGGTGRLAVVDDTTFSGVQMQKTKLLMRDLDAVYAVVYVNPLRPKSVNVVDLYAKSLPAPHVLEWNWANNGPLTGKWADVPGYGAGIAIDLDGIVVHDEFSGGRTGSPYMVPRMYPVPLIVTGRSEAHKRPTEAFLRNLRVQWSQLEMRPRDVELTPETAAKHKAKHFGESKCGIFMESCPEQARMIHEITKKPVICPRAETVFQS